MKIELAIPAPFSRPKATVRRIFKTRFPGKIHPGFFQIDIFVY
jgi:hypothetical protein